MHTRPRPGYRTASLAVDSVPGQHTKRDGTTGQWLGRGSGGSLRTDRRCSPASARSVHRSTCRATRPECSGAACPARPTGRCSRSIRGLRSRSTPWATRASSRIRVGTRRPTSALAASDRAHDPACDGPRRDRPDLCPRRGAPRPPGHDRHRALPRVPYGVISNRHDRGALPGEYPDSNETVSVFAGVEVVDDRSVAGGEHTVRFPLAPFLGIMGVAVVGEVRPHSVPRRQHRHQPPDRGHDPLPAGAGARRPRVRRRSTFRAG